MWAGQRDATGWKPEHYIGCPTDPATTAIPVMGPWWSRMPILFKLSRFLQSTSVFWQYVPGGRYQLHVQSPIMPSYLSLSPISLLCLSLSLSLFGPSSLSLVACHPLFLPTLRLYLVICTSPESDVQVKQRIISLFWGEQTSREPCSCSHCRSPARQQVLADRLWRTMSYSPLHLIINFLLCCVILQPDCECDCDVMTFMWSCKPSC